MVGYFAEPSTWRNSRECTLTMIQRQFLCHISGISLTRRTIQSGSVSTSIQRNWNSSSWPATLSMECSRDWIEWGSMLLEAWLFLAMTMTIASLEFGSGKDMILLLQFVDNLHQLLNAVLSKLFFLAFWWSPSRLWILFMEEAGCQ